MTTPPATEPPRIGLLGGSFDPVHCAHIALAQAALHELALTAVHLIPAAAPWQRAPLAASPRHRLAMLELATAGCTGLAVNPIELQRTGPTYTIDTLRALPADARYVWILGADQLRNFCTWRDWPEIVARVDLAVACRPVGSPPTAPVTASIDAPINAPAALHARLLELGRRLHHIPFAEMPVAASDIRARLARGAPTETLEALLAPAVLAYIRAHSLYTSP